MKIKQSNQFFYRVQDGDNLLDLCQRFNTCKENIIRNNPSIEIYAGEWVVIKENKFKIHYVKPMETLLSIADMFNISKEKIIEDNNLTSEKLFIGQVLKIY